MGSKFEKIMLRIGVMKRKELEGSVETIYWDFYNPLTILLMIIYLSAIFIATCTFGIIEYLYTNNKDTIKLFYSEFKHFIDIKNNKL